VTVWVRNVGYITPEVNIQIILLNYLYYFFLAKICFQLIGFSGFQLNSIQSISKTYAPRYLRELRPLYPLNFGILRKLRNPILQNWIY
jgi:hypothetical protein